MAQMAALELHVPQWRIDGGPGQEGLANRIIFDLDPGPGVPLTQCAQIAILIRDVLAGAGLQSWPVTSGGKGIHVYARIDPPVSPDSARAVARELAEGLGPHTRCDHRHDDQGRARRPCLPRLGQNSGSKTTLAPYSLRGRAQPVGRRAAHVGRNSPTPIWHNSRCTRYSSASADGDLLAGLDTHRWSSADERSEDVSRRSLSSTSVNTDASARLAARPSPPSTRRNHRRR